MNKRDRRRLDKQRERWAELTPRIDAYLDDLATKKLLPAKPEAAGLILTSLIGHLLVTGQMSEMEHFGMLVAADTVQKILDYGQEAARD